MTRAVVVVELRVPRAGRMGGIARTLELGSDSKCVARKTRCTFVKFHRQTAPVGPGHPSSLSASHPQSSSSHPSNSNSSLPHPSLASAHGGLGHLNLSGLGGMPPLSAPLTDAQQQPFLYAQQAASGGVGQFAFPSPQQSQNQGSPVFASNEEQRFAHHPGPGARFGGGAGGSAYGGGGAYGGEYEYADSEHSGHSGHSGGSMSGAGSIGGSRPASSAGGGEYAYLPNGRHHASASLDLHDPRHHSDLQHHPSHPDLHLQQRPPEFSSAFGLMSLDDPNVLAGLSTDGVPFFSHTGRTGLTPGGGLDLGGGGGGGKRMPPVPLAYHYSPPSSSHSHSGTMGSAQHPGQGQTQTPGTREAETRELREFWKAYMRTPLTGPGPHADALGLQTPSASAGAGVGPGGMLGMTPTREIMAGGGGMGGRRYRVASLPSVKTPEGEMDAAPVYPVQHMQGQHLSTQHAHAQQQQQQQQQQAPQGRTMHNADDLRSYEAAVLARKAPELVLRKPARRPTTSAAQPPPPPTVFEFGASGRERGGAAGAGAGAGPGLDASGGSQSSLAGAFGFAGAGYATAPATGNANGTGTGSQPNSPFPGTPTSTTSASASASASEDEGDAPGRPNFKRLPSQALGPMLTKRRRDRTGMETGSGMAHLAPPTPALGTGAAEAGPPSVNAYPDRPMISLRAPPPGGLPQRRARRLSEPVSPTTAAFVTD
ncbi:hypothetical protein C8F04DRAFT_1268146 [Mycena alexandri]|uniref:Uncharacterized protein n=1 Tax=Mycena alexandri TaxID=1745969 RepID=A0AAD6SGF7_9AGAR|nr:hypothetical protein C8F04DRAFT_1268146 [Mycena alexandri]